VAISELARASGSPLAKFSRVKAAPSYRAGATKESTRARPSIRPGKQAGERAVIKAALLAMAIRSRERGGGRRGEEEEEEEDP
jgi:hypothetical protein